MADEAGRGQGRVARPRRPVSRGLPGGVK